MKKIIAFIALICACNLTFAQTTVTSVFWGAKSSNKPNNPCKGALRQVCGQITTTVNSLSEFVTSVEKMTYDADNKLIYTDKYIDYRSMKDILEELELTGSSMTITDELEKPELEENPRYTND